MHKLYADSPISVTRGHSHAGLPSASATNQSPKHGPCSSTAAIEQDIRYLSGATGHEELNRLVDARYERKHRRYEQIGTGIARPRGA